MGIRLLMKSLIPVKHGPEHNNECNDPVSTFSVKEASPEIKDISPLPPKQDIPPETPFPREATAAPQKGPTKLNKEIMNIFVEEEIAPTPISRLAAGLPEIPIRDTYKECHACLEWILKFSKHR